MSTPAGGSDVHSLMNEVADREANAARLEASRREDIPYDLAGEERVSMTVGTAAALGGTPRSGIPVIGSYRKQLLRAFGSRALQRLEQCRYQGLLAREHGPRLMSWFRVAQSSHDPALLRFAALAACRWLPTEQALWLSDRRSDNSGRGLSCKLCGAAEDSLEHAMCRCPHRRVHVARSAVVSRVGDVVARAMRALGKAPATEAAGPILAWGSGTIVPAWFDPSGNVLIRLCPLVSPDVVTSFRQHGPLAGLLGILPQGADEALGWSYSPTGEWRRRDLGETQALLAELQLELMTGATRVWEERCRAFASWWASDLASAAVESRAQHLCDRARYKALRKAQSEIAAPAPRNSPYSPRPVECTTRRHVNHVDQSAIRDDGSMDAELAELTARERARAAETPFTWY